MRRTSTVRLPLAASITVAAAIGAITLGRPNVALVATPWVALLVIGLWTAHRSAPVRSQVTANDDRIVTGDEVELEIVVVAPGGGWVEARPNPQTVTAYPRGLEPPRVASQVGSAGSTSLSAVLPAPSWGSHDVGRVHLTLHEPFGLFERRGTIDEPIRVRVHPHPVELDRLVTPWLVRRRTGVHPSTAVDRGIEFADLRPFGTGDETRDINWRASARAGELVVSRRHPERSTEVVLLLDSFVESGHDVRAVVGLGIEAAVALAESHLAVTDRVGLVELGGVVRWVGPGTGIRQLHRLTDALLTTRLFANATERDLAVLPARALPPRSFILALSPLLDRRFIDALSALRAGGHDVSVIECMYEPSSSRGADSEVASAGRKIFEAERTVVRTNLAEQGVTIGQWHEGDHLTVALAEITERRRRLVSAASAARPRSGG